MKTSDLVGAWRAPLASLLVALTLTCLMSACGGVDGGGSGAPVGYSQGSITGFGSIIVNDIHFDESGATVLADDGSTPLQAGDLKLGMSVEVESGAIDTVAGTATATAVRLHSSLLGAVAGLNQTAGTFTLVGQVVQVTSATVFDPALTGGLAGMANGNLVEVHAVYDPVSSVYSARRIDPVTSASLYRVRGLVSTLTSNTFQIGSAVFVYTSLPAGVTEGGMARVLVRPTLDSQGRWVVSTAGLGERQPGEGAHVGLAGVVSSYTSLGRFVVDDVRVDASMVTPTGGTVAKGAWVKVEGVMSVGVLVADKVEVKVADAGHGGPGSGGFDMQLRGKVDSLNTDTKTFKVRDAKSDTLRDVRVDYSQASFLPSGSSAANLAAGVLVEVKGALPRDGHDVVATEIRFR